MHRERLASGSNGANDTSRAPSSRGRLSRFAEERRQDALYLRLSAPEGVTAFPDHDVGIETVGQLLEEASPLRVHACSQEGGRHRLLGCLLHVDRLSDDSSDGCSDVARHVLARARELDDPLAAPALGEQACSGGTDVPRRGATSRRRPCPYSPKHPARRTLRASSALRDSASRRGTCALRRHASNGCRTLTS